MACSRSSLLHIQPLFKFLGRARTPLYPNKLLTWLHFCPAKVHYCNASNCASTENESKSEQPQALVKQAVKSNPSDGGRVMLIDGTSILYRSYYKLIEICTSNFDSNHVTGNNKNATVPQDEFLIRILVARLHHGYLTHADGNGDWVLTIFTALSLIIDVLKFMPSHVAVVFDHDGIPFAQTNFSSKESVRRKGLNFRHTLYPAYKSNRPPTPDTIVQGFQYLKASLKAMAITVPGVEADDVIGTLAVRSVDNGYKGEALRACGRNLGSCTPCRLQFLLNSNDFLSSIFLGWLQVRVVSPDKDFFQIISPSLRLLRIAPRGFDMVSFGMEDFAERYGALQPSQIVDVMSLVGDKCDNIPGIDGIGNVHAAQLITKFGSLERLLECVDQVEEERIREALKTGADQALLSKNLALLRCDLPFYMVPFETQDLIFTKPKDDGEKFTSLLTAISAYAEGFSPEPLIRNAFYLWNKLPNHNQVL